MVPRPLKGVYSRGGGEVGDNNVRIQPTGNEGQSYR